MGCERITSFATDSCGAATKDNMGWDGHFGDVKPIGDGVSEMRWANGRRVYYVLVPERNMLLLLGGYKNGQKKDIKRAKKICEKYSCRVED